MRRCQSIKNVAELVRDIKKELTNKKNIPE